MTLKVRLDHINTEAIDIKSFRLMPVEPGCKLPLAQPGSHIDVHLPNGLIRQYSLCNGPAEGDFYQIAVKLEERSRGGSNAMHYDVCLGQELEISEPRNNFALVEEAKRHMLFAGGIGLTPLYAMARHLSVSSSAFDLHIFARSPDHIAFRQSIEALMPSPHRQFHTGLNPQQTEHALRAALDTAQSETHIYFCGPLPFMELVEKIAGEYDWPPHNLHREYFTAANDGIEDGAQEFDIANKAGDVVARVSGEETIVEALQRVGIDIDISCEQGICGTCLTPVLAGKPDHRDQFLTDDEKAQNDQMCLCVSRALSDRLTLDI